MTEDRKLKDFVEPVLSDSAAAAQWRRIERRLGAPPSRRPWFALAFATAAVVLGMVVLTVLRFRAPPAESAWNGAVLESGSDRVSVALNEGSRIELEPSSRILVREGNVHAVHLDMPKGGARFQVTHVSGRAFDVTARGVRVRVVGTKFTVRTEDVAGGARVTVAVDEGVVEVEPTAGGDVTRVRAGETFSMVTSAKVTKRDAPDPTADVAAKPPATEPAAPGASSEPEPPGGAAESQGAKASARARPTDGEPTAQELFERGNAARQSGDARGAATAYEALLRHHPTDARAGLAAFELGRLRMDQLGDLKGATVALERAAAMAPGFREDALARLVSAYGTLGDQARCEGARSAYLGSHPNGVHAAAVRKACGPGP
ncbi:MAG TPA: FecR domain-containing protein [Polyangiaceae bacterium]|nr:FecR domain-containing protein [Polyangiaceae bacterium]